MFIRRRRFILTKKFTLKKLFKRGVPSPTPGCTKDYLTSVCTFYVLILQFSRNFRILPPNASKKFTRLTMQNKDIKGAVLDVNTYVVQEILKDNLLD